MAVASSAGPAVDMSLTAITDDAARYDVEADGADGQMGLVAQCGREFEERLDIVEVARQAERHANRAGTLARAVLDHLKKPGQRHLAAAGQPREHVFFRQLLGRFAGSRVAEAPGAQRDASRARELLDAAVVQQMTVG